MESLQSGRAAPGTSAGGFPVVTVVTFLALAIYLVFLPSSVYWLDSPEFMAAGAKLSLAHPPGHPVVAMLLKLFMLAPIADVSFRANLFSAVCAALAAGLTGGIARIAALDLCARIGRNDADKRRHELFASAAGIAAGLLFAGCRSVFIQALAAEVYTLNAALLLGALYILMSGGRPGDARRSMAAAVLLGLALANHHFLAILAIPALVAAFWAGRASLKPLLTLSFVSLLVAVACYLYLPVRSAAGAWPVWSDVRGIGDFLWYVSASIFTQSVGGFEQSGGGPVQNLGLAFVLIGTSLGVFVPVLALGGTWIAARSGARRNAVVFVLMVAGGVCSKVMMGILDPSNPDDHGYFLMALSALAILAPLMFVLLFALSGPSRGGRALRVTSGIALVALAFFPWIDGIAVANGRTGFDDTRKVARMVWSDVPDGAVAFVSHYPVYFMLQYQQEVEGARPDVTLVQESLYYKAGGGRWYAEAMSGRDADLSGLMASYLASGRISWANLVELASKRPVVLEASPDFEARMADLSFAGWFFALDPGHGASGRGGPAAHVDALARGVRVSAGKNVETRRVAVRNLASSADWLGRAGDMDGAAVLLDGAAAYNPADRTIRARLAEIRGEQ